jgi:hypothetical protein
MVIRLPHGWLKHAGVHCVYKPISLYLCAFVGTVIVYIRIMPGVWIVQRLYSNSLETILQPTLGHCMKTQVMSQTMFNSE